MMENENLKKIDDILKRTNTDYLTAKEALEQCGGDVLDAIILIESQNRNKANAKNPNVGEQIFSQIKEILSKGNATKITIRKNNEIIINLPVTAGIIGAFAAPFLSAAGITAALLTQCSVEVTQSDGNVVNIGQKMEQGVDMVKDAMQDVKQGAYNFKNDFMNHESKNDFSQNMNNNQQQTGTNENFTYSYKNKDEL